MPTDAPEAATLPQSIFHIRPGAQVIISPAGFNERVRTTFTGLDKNRFFLVRLPAMAANGLAGLYDFLYQGNPVTVTFLHDGDVCAFKAGVQTYTLRPHPLLFLDFPERVESHKLRKDDRIGCSLPVHAEIGDAGRPSVLTDISRGGCRLVLEDEAGAAPVKVGDTLTFHCPVFGENGTGKLACQVRGVQRTGRRLTVGAAFTDLPTAVRDRVDHYLRTVGELLEDREAATG